MEAKNGPTTLLLVALGFQALLPFPITHCGISKEWNYYHSPYDLLNNSILPMRLRDYCHGSKEWTSCPSPCTIA